MVEMTVDYVGGLRCVARHGPSGTTLETDAPRDNAGKGERYSPTDLVATALATCIATTLGIVAQRKGWNIEGMHLRVEKQMTTEGPRRIDQLLVVVRMPAAFPAELRDEAERVIRSCPVHRSLHPDIKAPISVEW